jgi:hypothetical protein
LEYFYPQKKCLFIPFSQVKTVFLHLNNKKKRMAHYLDPKNDFIFKRIFGEHPDLLISFLNALMPLEPGKK